ncbi:MAG: ammonium transporter [Dehalococcoidia bacterium]|nr:MAG: ammonium transporter [Dehalococcoidia bacterium]
MYAVVSRPVRYRLTSTGIAVNRVVFRPWAEFSGYEARKGSVRLIGTATSNRFDVRVALKRYPLVTAALTRHLRPVKTAAGATPSVKAIRPALLIVPVVAVALLLGLGAHTAFADGPDDGPALDVSGTKVGTPEDLAGVGVGGGSLAVLDKDGALDADATAKMFAEAQTKEPFAYNLAAYVNQNRLAINFVWVLVTGYIVMFMQAGFAMVETGFCRAKSAMQVMMTNFMIYGVGMLAYWAVGFAIQFGGVGLTGPTNLGAGLLALDKEAGITLAGTKWGLFGYKGFFLGPNVLDVGIAVLFLFQMVFMDTAATILTGAVAERWRWVSFLIWGVFIGGFIYPMFGNWAWGGGWLFQLKDSVIGRPYVDFAGSGVVHSVGGWSALAAAWVLGPRLGKYNRDGSVNAMPGHNINMAAIGTFILAFGWFGFNPGSTLGAAGSGNLRIGEVAVVTMLAGAAGSVTAMAFARMTLGKYDPGYMINGILAGLVAITAPSGYVSPILAVLIGGMAGVLTCWAMGFIDRVLKVDDPVGAIAVHGVSGVFGILCVGLFADGTAPDFLVVGHPIKGLFFGDGAQLVAQLVGAVTVIVWSFGTSFVLFSVLKAMGIFRSKPEDEMAGLDIPEMGTHAYPPQEIPGYGSAMTGEFVGAR